MMPNFTFDNLSALRNMGGPVSAPAAHPYAPSGPLPMHAAPLSGPVGPYPVPPIGPMQSNGGPRMSPMPHPVGPAYPVGPGYGGFNGGGNLQNLLALLQMRRPMGAMY